MGKQLTRKSGVVKVLEIERHDDVRASHESRCDDVPVSWIRETGDRREKSLPVLHLGIWQSQVHLPPKSFDVATGLPFVLATQCVQPKYRSLNLLRGSAKSVGEGV